MRFANLCALLLGLLLVVAPPSGAQQTEQPDGTITIEDSAADDAAMAERIRRILSELDGYDDVTVSVSSGIVTLSGTTLDSGDAERLNELVGRLEGVVAIENEVVETTDVARRLNPAVQRLEDRLTQFVSFLPLAAVALAAFLAVVLAGFLLARLRQPWDRIAPNAFIADILRMLVRLAFVIGGLVVALDILGATALLSTILGAAGIAGLAIGFAVKDTVENFIASVMLSIRQPFRPNDTVEIEGDLGKVIRLTSRATILLSFDGNHIRIPNSTVFKSRIVNFTTNDERRFDIDLGVAPDTDLAAAVGLAQSELEALDFVLTSPAPAVWVEAVGDSTITVRATGWIAQHDTSFFAARGEAIRVLIEAFDTAGFALPEPTYRVAMVEPGAAGPREKPAAPKAPKPALAVATEAEQELDAIVAGERAQSGSKDLLTEDAPKE